MDVSIDRFYAIFVGAKEALIIDHCTKMQPELDSAIDLFNRMYPGSRIITGADDRTLKNTLTKKAFNRILDNGVIIPYSAFDAITAGAKVNICRS